VYAINFATRNRPTSSFGYFCGCARRVKSLLPLVKRIAERRTMNKLLSYTPMPSNLDPQIFSQKKIEPE